MRGARRCGGGGAFSGSDNFAWNNSTNTLTITGTLIVSDQLANAFLNGDNGKPVGTITDARLFDAILEDAEVRTQAARVVMGPALPVLMVDATLDEVAKRLGNGSPAVLVEQANGYGILTKQDIIGKLK